MPDVLDTVRSKVRALLVVNEEHIRRLLRALLAYEAGVEIVGESTSAVDGRRKIGDLQPDMVFMDIGTPGGSGCEMWHGIPEPHPYLIVVAGRAEFALQAFEMQADDYLVNPVQPQRFAAAMMRAKQRIAERRVAGFAMQIADAAISMTKEKTISAFAPSKLYPNQMTIRVRRRMFSIDVNDIIWIQGASQYSRLHTRTGEFLLSRTLASLECELDPMRFFRIHRSAIVNSAYVQEVRSRGDGCYNIYLHGGQALPMGRARREILSKLLGSMGGQDTRAFGVQESTASTGIDE